MNKRRRRRRYYIDAGDGVTLAVSYRGEMPDSVADAFKELARAAAARMKDDPPEPRQMYTA